MDLGTAIDYLRTQRAAFEAIGTVDLPVARQRATAVWLAAEASGDVALATEARDTFDAITEQQARWEQTRDTIQTVEGWLGGSLGAVPLLAWQVAAVLAVVVVIVALFRARDELGLAARDLVAAAVQSGSMTPADGAKLLGQIAADSKSGWPTALLWLGGVALAINFLPGRVRRA